ncbi:MAG: hypothetical protein GY799_31700 [Desulfobulbaceae bacterium]|nr:hypothetical protein [Desulfobulbaceae bacterium]
MGIKEVISAPQSPWQNLFGLFLPIPRYGQICFYTHEQRLSPKVKQAAKKCDTLLSTDKVMPSRLARKTFVLFAIGEWVVYGIIIKSTTY